MFYQLKLGITGMTSWLEFNKTREEVLLQFICPYVNREVTLWDGDIFNMSSCGYVRVYETDRPVDSDWPLAKADYMKEDKAEPDWRWDGDRLRKVAEVGRDVTEAIYREAIEMVASGRYRELRSRLLEDLLGREAFFVCPFDNPEIDHNYEYSIKPVVEKHGFTISRADEISNAQTITEAIMTAIGRARLVVADLTDARPNCYYEVGYAHAIGKPVVILAKTGTTRHFDLAAHNWTYWDDYKDLKVKFEMRLAGVFVALGRGTHTHS